MKQSAIKESATKQSAMKNSSGRHMTRGAHRGVTAGALDWRRAHAAGAIGWRRAHAELLRIARLRSELDWEEGCALLSAYRGKAHVRLGFGSFFEYIERLLGYSPRTTEDKLRVAQALERLPELASALRENQLSYSAVRELCRVATKNTEADWIAAARSRTVREVEQLVSGRNVGDGPDAPEKPEARTHVVRLEVSAATFAAFREAMAKARRDAGEPLDDDAALLLMARQVLSGPADSGRASYQIAMTICERCGHGAQRGKGEPISVPREVVEMAQCDAQQVPTSAARQPDTGGARQADTGSAGRVTQEAQSLNVGQREQTGGPRMPQAPARAAQTIPPAVRREVMQRHDGRCAVPGCRHAVFVDLHHIDRRAEGGTHDAERLVVLCSAHHRAVHEGRLVVRGTASRGFVFLHADGNRYGQLPSATAVDDLARAFRALRSMGYKESEARRGLDAARTHVGPEVGVEALIRAALAPLSERAFQGAKHSESRVG